MKAKNQQKKNLEGLNVIQHITYEYLRDNFAQDNEWMNRAHWLTIDNDALNTFNTVLSYAMHTSITNWFYVIQ